MKVTFDTLSNFRPGFNGGILATTSCNTTGNAPVCVMLASNDVVMGTAEDRIELARCICDILNKEVSSGSK